ncbi:hypothetical protein C8R44DRAFT_865257 [Mycena epipterygia]|nr:hypothetical protein C8R44DRAFT_865257 [Mycena epipterygia]
MTPQLINFSGLTNFSLSARHGASDELSLFPDPEPLQRASCALDYALYALPQPHVPHTYFLLSQSLALHTHTAQFYALPRPTLGSFGYEDDFTRDFLPLSKWLDFLATHPLELTCLRLAWNFRFWMSPEEDPAFETPCPRFSTHSQASRSSCRGTPWRCLITRKTQT